MIDIQTITKSDLGRLTAFHSGGIYMSQSITNPRLYRIGETLSLSSRQTTHRKKAEQVKEGKSLNWTVQNRPWNFIWALSIPEASRLSLLMCEHHLYSAIAREFKFVSKSGFEAIELRQQRLLEIAGNSIPAMIEIVGRQQKNE